MGEVEGGQGGKQGRIRRVHTNWGNRGLGGLLQLLCLPPYLVEGRLTGTLVRPSDIYEGRHFHCRRPSTKQRESRPLLGFVWQANCEGPTDIYCRKRDFMDEGLSLSPAKAAVLTG